jgi:hypothetical protein
MGMMKAVVRYMFVIASTVSIGTVCLGRNRSQKGRKRERKEEEHARRRDGDR